MTHSRTKILRSPPRREYLGAILVGLLVMACDGDGYGDEGSVPSSTEPNLERAPKASLGHAGDPDEPIVGLVSRRVVSSTNEEESPLEPLSFAWALTTTPERVLQIDLSSQLEQAVVADFALFVELDQDREIIELGSRTIEPNGKTSIIADLRQAEHPVDELMFSGQARLQATITEPHLSVEVSMSPPIYFHVEHDALRVYDVETLRTVYNSGDLARRLAPSDMPMNHIGVAKTVVRDAEQTREDDA